MNVVEAAEEVFPSDNEDGEEDSNGDGVGNFDPEYSPVFYIYTGVGSQSVVFKRKYSELAHAHSDEKTQK